MGTLTKKHELPFPFPEQSQHNIKHSYIKLHLKTSGYMPRCHNGKQQTQAVIPDTQKAIKAFLVTYLADIIALS
jgi:hypothetical protein